MASINASIVIPTMYFLYAHLTVYKPLFLPSFIADEQSKAVFLNYYSQLISTLSLNLTPHFVTARIITIPEEEEIVVEAKESLSSAMKMLLKPISASLECGSNDSFQMMLKIMIAHGNSGIKYIGEKMYKEARVLQPINNFIGKRMYFYACECPSTCKNGYLHILTVPSCSYVTISLL